MLTALEIGDYIVAGDGREVLGVQHEFHLYRAAFRKTREEVSVFRGDGGGGNVLHLRVD